MEKTSFYLGSEILCSDSYIGMKAIFQNSNKFIESVDKQRHPVTERRNLSILSRISNPIKKKPKYTIHMGPQSVSLVNLHKHILVLSCKPSSSHRVEVDCLES